MQRAKTCLCAVLFLAPALAAAQAVIYQPNFVESAPSAPAMQSVTPAYEIGQPFQSGDLKDFEKTVPADIKFESLPSTGWSGVMAR